MPGTGRSVKDNPRDGLGVEVASTEACLAAAGLDEALAVPVERGRFALAGDRTDDVVGDHFGLAFGEHSRLGERLSHLERDPGHIADGIHPGESGLQRVAVDRNPAGLIHQT